MKLVCFVRLIFPNHIYYLEESFLNSEGGQEDISILDTKALIIAVKQCVKAALNIVEVSIKPLWITYT